MLHALAYCRIPLTLIKMLVILNISVEWAGGRFRSLASGGGFIKPYCQFRITINFLSQEVMKCFKELVVFAKLQHI